MDRNEENLEVVNASGVALRKESVDRNCRVRLCPVCQWRSLSARRAWIEISKRTVAISHRLVALRKESVDRNVSAVIDDNIA